MRYRTLRRAQFLSNARQPIAWTLIASLLYAVISDQLPLTNSALAATSGATPSERVFIGAAQSRLQHRFPRIADARRAGYFRYTDEDSAGIIAYANLRWQSDPQHPSQLWYDEQGRLIGADFSRFVPHRRQRPELWGLQPSRWTHFIEHVHFGLRTGRIRYGALYIDKFRSAGGDLRHPSALPIVKLGFAKRANEVTFVFTFPELWVASIWLIPNPNGAFADTNPNVRVRNRNARDPHLPL